MSTNPKTKLYVRHTATPPHTMYAYGAPWVLAALYNDEIAFPTPEEAIAWWNRFVIEIESEGEPDVYYGNETESF